MFSWFKNNVNENEQKFSQETINDPVITKGELVTDLMGKINKINHRLERIQDGIDDESSQTLYFHHNDDYSLFKLLGVEYKNLLLNKKEECSQKLKELL